MFATQLIRILDTLPSPAKNANCVFGTDELHGNMKVNQNGIMFHINSPGRYADPLETEINNKDGYWNTPEFECAMVMDDFTNVNGSEIKRSRVFEKETDLYTDKNVMECELPELMTCYKESGAYHVVKDICVDEGKHSQENTLIDKCEDDEDKCDDIIKESHGTESLTPDRLRSSSGEDFGLIAANECGTQEKFDSALLTHDSHNDNPDLGEKGNHAEPLIQDGSGLEYEDDGKGQGNNGHSDLSERITDRKSLLEDGPQSSTVTDCDATDHEFGTKLVANIELPVAIGIQESSDDSDEEIAFCKCGPGLNADQGATDDCGPGDVVQTVEESVPAIDKLMYDASAEESDSNSMSSGKTFRPQTSLKFLLNSSEFGIDDDDDEQPHQIPVAEISKIPDSLSDAEEVSSSGQASNLTVNSEVESGINGLNLDTEKAASISEVATSTGDHDMPIEDNNLDILTKSSQEQYSAGESSFSVVGPIEGLSSYVGPIHEDEALDTASLARLVQRGDGESSFSVAGPVSGRITYSGPIPFSGSISLRSESSAASTRSFAFPVLQNEWNSSPVRMAKAERRRFHKHRGWRQGLLCCKF